MEKEKLSNKDNDFLRGLGIGSILPHDIEKIELVGILRGIRSFRKKFAGSC